METPESIIEHLRPHCPAGLIVLSSALWPLVTDFTVTREWKLPPPPGESASGEGRIAHCLVRGTSIIFARAVRSGEAGAAAAYDLLPFEIARKVDLHQCILVGTAECSPPAVSDYGVVTDHVNLLGSNPLIQCYGGRVSKRRFPDMTNVYGNMLQEKLSLSFGRNSGQKVLRGILVGVGENNKLRQAQMAALRRMGRCFFCSELVYEAIAAHSAGMDVGCAVHFGAAPGSHDTSGEESELLHILSQTVQTLFSRKKS